MDRYTNVLTTILAISWIPGGDFLFWSGELVDAKIFAIFNFVRGTLSMPLFMAVAVYTTNTAMKWASAILSASFLPERCDN